MPRKMRRAALRSALSVKASEDQIVVVDALDIEAPRTKVMVSALERLGIDGTALLLLAERDETVEKSVRNLPHVKVLNANYLNIRDLLSHDKILIPMDSLQIIERVLG
jgi:large subunit ribosomal protein L4